MKLVIAILLVLSLPGCGYVDRSLAGITGSVQETCHAGVTYLQFTSGASVKYLPDGHVTPC
jgi:hypothetical protein